MSGAYANSELDLFNVDVDKWNVSFGYHHSLNDQADWFAEVGYTKLESDESVLDDDAYELAFGLRGSLSDRFEGTAKLTYNDGVSFGGAFYPQYDNAFSVSGGLKWNINEMWGIVGEIEAYEDATDYTIGVRASF